MYLQTLGFNFNVLFGNNGRIAELQTAQEYHVCLTWLPSHLLVALYDSPELEPGSGVGVHVPFVVHVHEGRTVGAHL